MIKNEKVKDELKTMEEEHTLKEDEGAKQNKMHAEEINKMNWNWAW